MSEPELLRSLDRFSESARAAFVRQELTVPALALIEYVQSLQNAASLLADHEVSSLLKIMEGRAKLLPILIQDYATLLTHPHEDASRTKAIRHDLRAAASYIVSACEELLEVATNETLEKFQEPLETTRQTAKRIIEVTSQLNCLETESSTSPLANHSFQQMLQKLAFHARLRTDDAQTGRVLIVDDNEFGADLVARMLRKQGHSTEVVSSGPEALERLENLTLPKIDVVLLDVLMPGMTGPEVLLRLKEQPATRDLPVLMVSALTEDETVLACIAAGAVDYLTRPVNPELLRARIQASLSQKRLRDLEQHFQARIDGLVQAILPASAIDEWKQHGTIQPRRHELVGVLFLDVVGFTSYSEMYRDDPAPVIALLQQLIVKFEQTAARHDVQKIKTIGDAFMAVAGLAEPIENPALSLLRCAIDLQKDTQDHPAGWKIRIGIHIGPVVTGILGKVQFSFDVWGHTVNAASRVESNGVPGKVTLSEEAWQQVAALAQGTCRTIQARGLGSICVYDFEQWKIA